MSFCMYDVCMSPTFQIMFVCVEEDEVVLPPGVDDVDPLLAGDDGSVTLLPDLLVGVCYWGPPGAEDG